MQFYIYKIMLKWFALCTKKVTFLTLGGLLVGYSLLSRKKFLDSFVKNMVSIVHNEYNSSYLPENEHHQKTLKKVSEVVLEFDAILEIDVEETHLLLSLTYLDLLKSMINHILDHSMSLNWK